jgi:hypothetical protein
VVYTIVHGLVLSEDHPMEKGEHTAIGTENKLALSELKPINRRNIHKTKCRGKIISHKLNAFNGRFDVDTE